MSANDIGLDGITKIAKTIKKNQTLLKLYISDNNIGAVVLSESIVTTNTLEVLDLSGNGIDLGGIKAVAKVLMCNTSLRILHINNTPICQDSATVIAKAITTNKTLEIL